MPKKILAVIIAASLGISTASFILADSENSANISDVPKNDLKQKISIEETGNGNLALLKGAKITELASATGSTTSSTFKVKILGQEYTIEIGSATNVVRYSWGKSSINLSEFSVGDIVNVYGMQDSVNPFLIHAKTVRNVSIQIKHVVLKGTITSINAPNSFVITKGQGEATSHVAIIINPDTKIYQGKDLKTFSDLKPDMQVLVRGTSKKYSNKMQEVRALLIRINPLEMELK